MDTVPLVGTGPIEMAVDDIDSDGFSDIAITFQNSMDVWVLYGTKSGGFIQERVAVFEEMPYAIDVADLDADGMLDLLVTHWDGIFPTPAQVAYLKAISGRQFEAQIIDTNGGSGAVVAAQLTGDDTTDVAIGIGGVPGEAATAEGEVQILQGGKDGPSLLPESIPTALGIVAIDAGDFNSDGVNDLLVTAYDGGVASVLLGDGNGKFSLGSEVNRSYPWSGRFADLSGDGLVDIVALHGQTPPVSIHINDSGMLRLGSEYDVPGAIFLSAGDVDGDGFEDVAIVAGRFEEEAVFVIPGPVTEDTPKLLEVPLPQLLPATPLVADIDGDEIAEILVLQGGQLSIVRSHEQEQ